MKTINVNASIKYQVLIGRGLLKDCGKLTTMKAPCKAVIVSDSNVYPIYGETVKAAYEDKGFDVKSFVFPAGENSKNMGTLVELLNFMAASRITRSGLIIALGGGVTGDLAGFAASVYLRGIDFLQIPTTFLSAIDSSVGGKTGVNLDMGKNLAGAFKQPIAVFCDTNCLDTLPKDVFSDGFCEAVKYGCIADEKLFNTLSDGNIKEQIEDIIAICVNIKREIVEQDEMELNLRMVLNFGHTAAHAIEAISNYNISHGRAVAMGMVIAAKATNEQCAQAIEDIFNKQGIDIKCPYTPKQLAEKAASDKKTGEGKITLVLLEKIGKAYLKKIDIVSLECFFQTGIGKQVV